MQRPRKEVYIDGYNNNGYLDASYHYVPDEKQDPQGKAILKIKIPGDGNCGFYSIALGVAHLILQGKLALSERRYKHLLGCLNSNHHQQVLRERAQYYRDGIAKGKRVRLDGCLPAMQALVDALDRGELDTFEQFKSYLLHHQGYYQVLALAIVLGPALRDLSMQLLNELRQITQIEGVSVVEHPVAEDGRDAEFPQLNLLSGFFEVHLIAYNKENVPFAASYGDLRPALKPAKVADVDPLLGKKVKEGHAQPSLSPMPAEVKKSDPEQDPAEPDQKPVLALLHSAHGHYDLLLPMSDYLSPPFYFGFNFAAEHVNFDEDHLLSKVMRPEEFLSDKIQADLAAQKQQLRLFQDELQKLTKAVAELSDAREIAIGKKLIRTLESNFNALFTPANAPAENRWEQHQAFVTCSRAVATAHQHFQNHSPSVANILANIGLLLLGIVPYLIVASIHYASTGRIGFFNKPPALLRNELPAFSAKLGELHRAKVDLANLPRQTEQPEVKGLEPLPDLPPMKEWSRIRF